MLYELGLQATFAVCLWILIDLYGARGPRSRRVPILWMAAGLALWVMGELITRHPEGPTVLLIGRRLLYLGVCVGSVAWLWTAASLSGAKWFRHRPWLVAAASAPLWICASFLFWEQTGLFVDWYTPAPPGRGPVFYLFAAWAWGFLAVGGAHLLAAANRAGIRGRVPRIAIVLASGAPIVASFLHTALGLTSADPTPLVLGVTAVTLRLSVLDSGLAAILPMGQRAVLDQLKTGVLLADPQGEVIDANDAARRLLGGRHLIGSDLADLLAVAREDPSRVIAVETAPLRRRFGEAGRAALLTDRTDAARIEHQLLESQKLESLGILAGGVAHDFNNLLTGILNNLSSARAALAPDHPAVEALDEVEQGAHLASVLTGQLLTYAGRTRLSRQPVDLSRSARELRPLLRRSLQASVELRLDLAEGLPAVEADPGQVEQVLMNLVSNGAAAIDGDGSVTVRTGRGEPGADAEVYAPADADTGHWVVLEVVDTGRGMDAATRRHIFDPFFTTRDTGHGLGLAATLGIVRAHGGAIEVATAPGAGTTFRLCFPASERRPKPVAPKAELATGSGTILAVDDEEYVLDAIFHSLARLGYTVLRAPSGERALEILAERTGEVDLVLLDLSMPGMGGGETLAAIRERFPELPVLLSTGYGDERADRLCDDRFTAILRKPYDPEGLGAKVGELLAANPR